MAVWWLAIDRNQQNASYEELKYRKVVAQGWPALGNLVTLLPLVQAGRRDPFCGAVQTLYECVYPGGQDEVGRIMWQLLRLQEGDLVVGIEGGNVEGVRGICQIEHNGWDSYRYDDPGAYHHNYAHTVGCPVEWIDWEFGFIPQPPAQSVPGIRALQNDCQQVIDAWLGLHHNE